ncbi:MAG: PIG-L family deacetylase [Clostridiales bacterium]|nr:PIG-L family deacetylase [Clostridiales bacterium]
MKKCFLLLVLIACAALAAAASAEAPEASSEAPEITSLCTFISPVKESRLNTFSLMTDQDVSTFFALKEKKGWLIVESPEPVWGVSVMLYNRYGMDYSYDLEIEGADGKWSAVARSKYLSNWHPLDEPVTRFRIQATSKERLRIAELRLFGKGEKPAEIQDWQDLDKADIMLLACHPDDEVLWFAGLMPVYADRGYKVQLAMMTPASEERQLELLQSAWHCGMRYYPYFIGLHDKNGHKNLERQYTMWKSKTRVHRLVTECFRRFKPEVVVTHGEEGEYGHSAHKATADSAKACLKHAANSSKYPDSAKKYGTWQIKKLYLHEYAKNKVVMDWSQPLASFGGKTGFDIAGEAFQYHVSQVKIGHYEFKPVGDHDNTAFGLYYSAVGPDTGKNDFMENIN